MSIRLAGYVLPYIFKLIYGQFWQIACLENPYEKLV